MFFDTACDEWQQVSSVVRHGLTTLARYTADVALRLEGVERAVERSQPTRGGDDVAAIVARLDAAVSPPDRRAATNLRAQERRLRSLEEAPRGDSRAWQDAFEKRICAEVDVCRADAAAARAVSHFKGAGEELVASLVSAAVDDAAKPLAAAAAAAAAREVQKQLASQGDADVGVRRAQRDAAEAKQLARDAWEACEARVTPQWTRQEIEKIVDDAAARRDSGLKVDALRGAAARQPSRRHRDVDADAGEEHQWQAARPPPPPSLPPRRVDDDDGFARSAVAPAGDGSPGDRVSLGRRCDAAEVRCEELVRALNQKAYKSDVSNALAALEASVRAALRAEAKKSEKRLDALADRRPVDSARPRPQVTDLDADGRNRRQLAVVEVSLLDEARHRQAGLSRLEAMLESLRRDHAHLADATVAAEARRCIEADTARNAEAKLGAAVEALQQAQREVAQRAAAIAKRGGFVRREPFARGTAAPITEPAPPPQPKPQPWRRRPDTEAMRRVTGVT
ncbi:hypothetical protein M885DRAFT_90631 [Pelagophyceae sp. CCMP2097]|nr:hypothetical protein M885DRAFT_90631 [Pelagophyceae sp. CCMP2097]